MPNTVHPYTCFDYYRLIASGPLSAVAVAAKHVLENHATPSVLIFDNATGRCIDIDISGSDEEVAARYAEPAQLRGRGRPKLGVVPREVTLLPRHWEWLAAQPGGASVALRKLVDEARRTHDAKDKVRMAQERAYHFMSAMAGDLPGFEEAARALFAHNEPRFRELIADWPDDVRDHLIFLAFGTDDEAVAQSADAHDFPT